ncbi:MAG: ABC transporter ATP-binding protein [Pontiella sp.]
MSTPIIQIHDLSITLSGNEILKGISLNVAEGEYVSIIGPNGAGKTTLIKCIAGIYDRWDGSIQLAGKVSTKRNSREIARLRSYVPQAEGRTNPLTVEEFIATGRYPHLSAFTSMRKNDFEVVDRELERAGLQPLRKRRMNTLSGGERQMAFIAAALAQDAQILLLDEPSTFLDYRHQHHVASLLKSACQQQGITVVAVHHDLNTATACSHRIHAIKKGSIVFSGTPQETANRDVLESIYGTPFLITPSADRATPLITAGGAQ